MRRNIILALIFIAFVGDIILILNWNKVFGSSKSDEPSVIQVVETNSFEESPVFDEPASKVDEVISENKDVTEIETPSEKKILPHDKSTEPNIAKEAPEVSKTKNQRQGELEIIKVQIVKEFNANQMNKATKLINDNKGKFPELAKYAPSIKYILKVRQGGVSKEDKEMLKIDGFYDSKGKAVSSKFQVESLDELGRLEQNIKSTMVGF